MTCYAIEINKNGRNVAYYRTPDRTFLRTKLAKARAAIAAGTGRLVDGPKAERAALVMSQAAWAAKAGGVMLPEESA